MRELLHRRAAPGSAMPQSQLVQRRCACGNIVGPDGECAACRANPLSVQRSPIGSVTRRSMLQAKLVVGAPHDQYEQEADHMADTVMSMPQHTAIQPSRPQYRTPAIQRQSDEEEAEESEEPAAEEIEELEEEPEESESIESLQAKGQSSHVPNMTPALASSIVSLRGGGEPLSKATRSFFEPRFGHSFGNVRIHTDAAAAATAQALQARAYTLGHDIVFAPGQYNPGSSTGQRLLAHELTHVIQQGHGAHLSTPVANMSTISRVSEAAIQRDEDPEKAKGAEEARKQALDTVAEIETNWKEIVADAPTQEKLKAWITHGDAVVKLVRQHTEAALDASAKGDSHLYTLYLNIVESDKLMYDFIAWHVVLYANVLELQPDIARIRRAFDADDREFTGRSDAEELTRLTEQLIDRLLDRIPERLKNISVTESIQVKRQGMATQTITATNAFIEKNRAYFSERRDDVIKDQATIQTSVQHINNFLVIARKEGFRQAIDAVQEFYSVRGQIRGRGPKASKAKGGKPKRDTKPKQETKKTETKKDTSKDKSKDTSKQKEKDKDKKKEKGTKKGKPYPLCWPTQFGGPPMLFGTPVVLFIRTPNTERDTTDAGQRRLQLVYREKVDPGFVAKDFHVHHIVPLFLGGLDATAGNLMLVPARQHLRGHAILAHQPQMARPPKGLKPLPTNIYKHPAGTTYYLAGFKTERNETCGK